MSVGKIIVFAVVLGAAIMAMRAKGLSVGDVLQLAKEESRSPNPKPRR